jgi:hypothetical protein
MNVKKWAVIFLYVMAFSIHAQDDFLYGAIRSASSNDYRHDYTFLMLPTASTKGKKFNYYDYGRDKITCCITVSEGPFDDTALEKKFDIPTVWVTDITVPAGGHDVAGAYTLLVYLGAVDKKIPPAQDIGIDFEGFIVDEKATLGKEKRTLNFENRVYRVKRKIWSMATDAGSLYEYTLTEISAVKPTENLEKLLFISE